MVTLPVTLAFDIDIDNDIDTFDIDMIDRAPQQNDKTNYQNWWIQ